MAELHHKPTKAELEANAQAALAALENPEPTEPEPSEPIPSAPIPSDPVPSEPDTSEPSPSAPIPSAEIDYKKRYSDSTREAQRLAQKNKGLAKSIADAAAIQEVTDEDVQAEYPEWNDMTPTEQRLAKDNILSKKRFELIEQATSQFKNIDDWTEKVDTYVGNPVTLNKHPELEGKVDEFKEFANRPTWQNIDFDNIILGFLGEQAKNKVPKKGKMFPTGGGGGAVEPTKPSDGKISAAEGRTLMKTDYQKFKQMLKDGKIRNE